MAGSSNIYVWASGEDSKVVKTIQSITDYFNSTQRKTGFLVADKINTDTMNRILHQVSLIAAGLSKFVANNGETIADKGGGGATEVDLVASAIYNAIINSLTPTSNNSNLLKILTMLGATASANGRAGYVPQPLIANRLQYLRGDGKWATPPDTKYSVFTSSVAGLVPSGSGNSTSKYLRGDGAWATPPDTNTTYSTFTSSRSGLVPSGGSSSTFLRGDGNWATPSNTTYSVFTSTKAGLVPSGGSSTKFLRGDGTWATVSTGGSSSGGSSSGGTVSKISSKKSVSGTTTWTLTGLNTGKPIFIVAEGTTKQNWWVNFTVPSSCYGATTTYVRLGVYCVFWDQAQSTVNSLVVVPKSSSVTFTINDSDGDEWLYAFH